MADVPKPTKLLDTVSLLPLHCSYALVLARWNPKTHPNMIAWEGMVDNRANGGAGRNVPRAAVWSTKKLSVMPRIISLRLSHGLRFLPNLIAAAEPGGGYGVTCMQSIEKSLSLPKEFKQN
jgi:hypothetical protein